jgi:hypothetical protein
MGQQRTTANHGIVNFQIPSPVRHLIRLSSDSVRL